MCDGASAALAIASVASTAVGAYSQMQSNKAQKAAARSQAEAIGKLSQKQSLKESTSKTASTLADNVSPTKRTLGSLRIPLEKTMNTKDTGINRPDTNTGLNIPM